MTNPHISTTPAMVEAARAAVFRSGVPLLTFGDADHIARTVLAAISALQSSIPAEKGGDIVSRLCEFHKRLLRCFQGATGEPPPTRPRWFEPTIVDCDTLLDAAVALQQSYTSIPADEWQDFGTAPRDGTRILAITGEIADERWSNLSHREFVIWHLGRDLDLGWSLYPGMGVGDNWFAAWRPLPAPPRLNSQSGEREPSDATKRMACILGAEFKARGQQG